jgi:hypothetical protein
MRRSAAAHTKKKKKKLSHATQKDLNELGTGLYADLAAFTKNDADKAMSRVDEIKSVTE